MAYFAVLALCIALDQLTKYLAVVHLQPVGTMPFIPGLVHLHFIQNTGAAFSMFEGMQSLLICVTFCGLMFIAYWVFAKKTASKLEAWSLLIVLAGGFGNFIDRVRVGYVVDFFEFSFISFPVFNVADCFISVGMVFFATCVIKEELKNQKKQKAAKT